MDKTREAAIKEWGERHGLNLHGNDLKVAFEDAETLFGAASVDRKAIVREVCNRLYAELELSKWRLSKVVVMGAIERTQKALETIGEGE